MSNASSSVIFIFINTNVITTAKNAATITIFFLPYVVNDCWIVCVECRLVNQFIHHILVKVEPRPDQHRACYKTSKYDDLLDRHERNRR